MNLVNKCVLVFLIVVIPTIVGGVWNYLLCKRNNNQTMVSLCKLLIQAWIYGSISMFAVMQLIAIPMFIKKMLFTKLVQTWSITVAALCLAGLICWIIILFKEIRNFNIKIQIKKNIFVITLLIISTILILLQARISAKYQHTDDDDARFVVLEVIAVERDQMLTRSPMDGNPMYWYAGEVKKDYTSPWTMYVATLSKISNIPPAILSHRMLPMFLIPLCYAAYFLLACNIFKDNLEKIFTFMLLLSIGTIFGFTSTHTIPSVMLLRIWQGKALYAGFMIPVLINVLFNLYEKPHDIKLKVLLLFTCTAACLLSGSGIVLTLILVGIYGLMILLKYRKFINTITIWLTCVPCIVYGLCNVFWFEVFGLIK